MTRTFGEVGAFYLQNQNHHYNSYANETQFIVWCKLLPELIVVFCPNDLPIYLVFQFQEKKVLKQKKKKNLNLKVAINTLRRFTSYRKSLCDANYKLYTGLTNLGLIVDTLKFLLNVNKYISLHPFLRRVIFFGKSALKK